MPAREVLIPVVVSGILQGVKAAAADMAAAEEAELAAAEAAEAHIHILHCLHRQHRAGPLRFPHWETPLPSRYMPAMTG
jgi:REP element-mobilizing transposase RayT